MPAHGDSDTDEVRADGGHVALQHHSAHERQAYRVALIEGFAKDRPPSELGCDGFAIEAARMPVSMNPLNGWRSDDMHGRRRLQVNDEIVRHPYTTGQDADVANRDLSLEVTAGERVDPRLLGPLAFTEFGDQGVALH